METKKLRVMSLFSGCGGLDLGFLGGFSFRQFRLPKNHYNLAYSNDFDRDAERVYNQNSNRFFGKHRLTFGDIRNVDTRDLPEFDVLLAGFPCQPFSNAGNRGSTEDSRGRGTLFYECERILKAAIKKQEVPPAAFVFENVRGILSSKMPDGTPVVSEITSRMRKLGYLVTTSLVNSSHYGVPQNRMRVLMIGVRKEFGEFDFATLDKVRDAIGLPSSSTSSIDLTIGAILSDIPAGSLQLGDYWRYSPSGQRMVEQIGPVPGGSQLLMRFKGANSLDQLPQEAFQGRSWKNIDPDDLSPRFRKIYDNPKKYHAPNFYRRFALGEICGTITASAQPENCGITHPYENRRMSIREVARVQSFPDAFDFATATLPGAYKVIGNAVPPILGWVVARSLQQHLTGHSVDG